MINSQRQQSLKPYNDKLLIKLSTVIRARNERENYHSKKLMRRYNFKTFLQCEGL